MQDFLHHIDYEMVSSPSSWLKANTNGSSRRNPGSSSTIFCIRNFVSNFLVAKELPIKNFTSLATEVRAIRECLLYCDHMLTNIIIESDSMILYKF